MNIFFQNSTNQTGSYFEYVKDVGIVNNHHLYAHLYIKFNNEQEYNLNNPMFYLDANQNIMVKDESNTLNSAEICLASVYMYVNENNQPFSFNDKKFIGRGQFSFINLNDLKIKFKTRVAWIISGQGDELHKNQEIQYQVVNTTENYKKYKCGTLILFNGCEFKINDNFFNFTPSKLRSVNKDILSGQEWISNESQLSWPNYLNLEQNYELVNYTGTLFNHDYVNGIYQDHKNINNSYQHRLVIDSTKYKNLLYGKKIVVQSLRNNVSQQNYLKEFIEYNSGVNMNNHDLSVSPHNVFEQTWLPHIKEVASTYVESNENVKVFYVNLIKQDDNNHVDVYNNFGEQVKLYYGHKYICEELNSGNWVIMNTNKYGANESIIVEKSLQNKFRKEFL